MKRRRRKKLRSGEAKKDNGKEDRKDIAVKGKKESSRGMLCRRVTQ